MVRVIIPRAVEAFGAIFAPPKIQSRDPRMIKLSTPSLPTLFFVLARPLFVGVLLALSACSRYSVSVNDNIVYEPPQLFSDFNVEDSELRTCLQKTIAEANVRSAEQLRRLICPAGSISTLSGIEVFSQIEYLGLAENNVQVLAPITELTQLKQADLRSNNVKDFSVLLSHKSVLFLNAKGNTRANCDSLQASHETQVIHLPKHCMQTNGKQG